MCLYKRCRCAFDRMYRPLASLYRAHDYVAALGLRIRDAFLSLARCAWSLGSEAVWLQDDPTNFHPWPTVLGPHGAKRCGRKMTVWAC
jgi:hypothetical protein